jgi:predicted anti-sigma-YlaC factor YlaD
MTAHSPTGFTCAEFDSLLPELMEGDADAAARAGADEHLETCARCRGLMADLSELRDDAARLPVLSPSHDLWPSIATRLTLTDPRRAAPKWYARPGNLAAAAVLLVTLTSAVTWNVATRAARPEAAVATGTEITPGSRVALAYASDIATLNTLVEQRAATLDSVTARQVTASLLVIDNAIADVRAALDANPSSTLLSRQLAHAYERKVSALRRIAEMSAE